MWERQPAMRRAVVFEVFLHEKKLRDGGAVGFFQAFPKAAAGERNNGFGGEHPCTQKRHDARNDYAALPPNQSKLFPEIQPIHQLPESTSALRWR